MYRRYQRPNIWQEMDQLQREMNRLFDATSRERVFQSPSYPAINIWTNQDGQLITAEMPGVHPDDLEIDVTGDALSISGERKEDEVAKDARFHRRERSYGSFSRTIQLPFMEIQQQEGIPTGEMERTRSRRVFLPKADIYETEKEIIILADIPGANDKTVDITLEKNVLSITAYIEPMRTSEHDIAYAEYEEGDYQRSFRLSDEIDRDKIEASVSEGVLRLRLPKSQEAATKKITVKAK